VEACLPHSIHYIILKGSFIMQERQISQPSGLGLVMSAAILWGTIGVATQAIYNLDNTTSLFINLARMLIATPVLLIACWRVVGERMFDIRWRDLLIMVLAGVCLALSHATYFAAIRYSGVTVATLLTICIAPLVVTGLSVLLKLEKPTRQVLIALVCALTGSLLLVGLQSVEAGQNFLLGAFSALVAAVSYACVLVCGRLLAACYHPLQVTTITFATGTLVLILINLVSGVVMVQTAQGWLLVLYLGLVPTACAYWLFQMGLRSVSATVASIVSMIDPLVAALLAWGLFGERLTPSGIAGAALLMGSILLLALQQPNRK
jgi:drug/metabolite transporter, DME family